MSKPKFTKGPWEVGADSTSGQYIVAKFDESLVIVAESYPDGNQDFEANARLIAAAPTLLEQLEALVFELSACEKAGNWKIEAVQRGIKKRLKSAEKVLESLK